MRGMRDVPRQKCRCLRRAWLQYAPLGRSVRRHYLRSSRTPQWRCRRGARHCRPGRAAGSLLADQLVALLHVATLTPPRLSHPRHAGLIAACTAGTLTRQRCMPRHGSGSAYATTAAVQARESARTRGQPCFKSCPCGCSRSACGSGWSKGSYTLHKPSYDDGKCIPLTSDIVR